MSYVDPDPNHPLRQLPQAAQEEFLRSGLTKEEVMRDWRVFVNCIYFQCQTAFEKPPVELIKQQPNTKDDKSLNRSDLLSEPKHEGHEMKESTEDMKSTTRSRSRSTNEREKQKENQPAKGPKTALINSLRKEGEKDADVNRENRRSNSPQKRNLSEEQLIGHSTTESESKILMKEIYISPKSPLASSADSFLQSSSKMSKNCENSPPCDAKDNENKEFSQQRQSKNQQASPSASYESMKSQNESKNDMKSDEKVRTTNNSQKEKGIIENETPQCKEGTLSEQKAALEKESNPSPQIISFKTRNKSESPVAKKRSKHRVYRSKKNETQPRNSKDSLNTNTKAVQIANMSISNGEIPEERKIEIKPEETKVSSETSPPESLRINTNTKDTLQSNTEGTKVIKTAKELVNDEKNDREKEISPQKKNTPQNVVSSTDNETTVITHHSNTRKSSTASSKGASPSVKKKMKAVAQISEEELNQLFVKANPKDFYTISYKIGMGSFAKVYIGKPLSKTEKSKRVAIKVMHIETPTSETKENETDKEKEKRKNKEKDARKDRRLKQVNIYSVANEIRLLNSCQHKNIVKHIMSFVWKEQIWTVMEYCDGGTLKDLLRVTLDENHIAYVLRELLEALKYLHERNRIHRDLKSDNILLNVNGDVKLADLGLSTEVGDESAMETSIAGSRYWLAPEMIRGEGYNVKADIWSLGCVALEMAEGKPPYYQYHPLKAIFYTATRGAPPLAKPNMWSSLFTDFLARCFQPKPQHRATAAELLQHPFLQKAAPRKQMESLLKMAFMLKATEGFEC